MDPYHLPKPDRYLYNFGKKHGIKELSLNKENHNRTYNRIRCQFILTIADTVPKKKEQYKLINRNFEEFKRHVSKEYSHPPAGSCFKKPFGKEAARKILAKCMLSTTRKERAKYYCPTCEAWHLTSTKQRKK